MANDFMKNANKVSLDGEVVSFSNTLPIVDAKEDIVETPIVEESKREEKVEETVVDINNEEAVAETEDEEITEYVEETTEESDDEE